MTITITFNDTITQYSNSYTSKRFIYSILKLEIPSEQIQIKVHIKTKHTTHNKLDLQDTLSSQKKVNIGNLKAYPNHAGAGYENVDSDTLTRG